MSNIDTKSIISGLMAVERRPQDQLKSRISELQRAQSAWSQIGDKLTALKTAAEAVAPTGSIAKLVAVSSDDTSLVGVRATGSVSDTSVSIEVDQLAAAHSVVMTDTFTGTSASDGGRSLNLTVNGSPHTFTSDDGTIGGLARAINAGGVGVTARVLQTGAGTYQLALTANKTGALNAFTVGAGGWSGSTVARAGADAQFKVDGVSLTRSSNTLTDVLDGLELTLKGRTSGQVTVAAQRDDDAIVSKVKALVDAANAVVSTVNAQTATSASAAARGALASDGTARRATEMVRSLVAKGITGADGSTVPTNKLGISLTKEGAVTFDEAALRETLSSSPETVLNALGRGGSSNKDGIKVTNVASNATDGPRTVTVTRAATQAAMIGVPVPPPPPGATIAMTVVTPNGSYSVSFTAGSSYAETAANLTVALRGLGLKMGAAANGGGTGMSVTADKFGSGSEFEIQDDPLATYSASAVGLAGTATDGLDAQATVTHNGTTNSYTASGRSLVKDGIAYTLDATADQVTAAGGSLTATVNITSGLAGALSTVGSEGSSTGMISRAKTALADRISDLQNRIDRWDNVLTKRQSILEKRFSNMELMLQKLQGAGQQAGFASA